MATDGNAKSPDERPLAIEARRLGRRFGARLALDRLDLRIERGESFGLLGANGAGKTTFLRLCAGFLLPSEGALVVAGLSPSAEPSALQRRIGVVMETARLYPELRVAGFLRFCALARGLTPRATRAALDRVIHDFALEPVARRAIGLLSKGFQQRVSLAQAFLHDPELLIVDEPSSGLDPVQRNEVQQLLQGFRGERTLLLCTHDLDEARRLCPRVAVLQQGRLVACGASSDLLARPDLLDLFRSESAQAERSAGA